ncbi:MAG: hypothetical protein IPN34_20895 [Planctomycetes bacterium]|nr:hypothetical protein [Planctomycetota bacterium]
MAEMNLEEMLATEPKFEPYVDYDRETDCLEVMLRGDMAVAERVDQYLTVYWGEDDRDALMGCEFKGVQRLLQQVGACGFEIKRAGRLKLEAVISAYRLVRPETIPVRSYHKLMGFAKQREGEIELEQVAHAG